MTDYGEFLTALQSAGWSVPNKSFASKTFFGQWQVAFVRMGGKFQLPGQVTFVVCIRHTSLRDCEKERRDVVKKPFDFPFKLTVQDIASGNLRYSGKLLGFDMSTQAVTDDWSSVFSMLNEAVPHQLSSYSASQLRKEILQYGESGYIEKIWAEDLA
jgi:hypothetical protein